MKQKYYYKVIRKEVGIGLVSAVTTNDKSKVIYKLNEWVKPNIEGSRLLVFKTRKQAKNFRAEWHYIFKCEVKRIKKILLLCSHTDYFKTFWNAKPVLTAFQQFPSPHGTHGATAVKLIKEVT